MHREKETQEITLLGRLISLEALVLLMGVISLVYGLATGQIWNIMIGAAILAAAALAAWKCRRGAPKRHRNKGEPQ